MSLVTIGGNILLTVAKLIVGVISHSSAVISDAVHSASDVFSTIIVIIGIKMAAKSADKEHQYGHERFECIAAVVLAVVLCVTGIGIGYSGARSILFEDFQNNPIKNVWLAIGVSIISIIGKECMCRYTLRAAKKLSSSALKADAWHHRSDALSSVASFLGVLGAVNGMYLLDPLASIVICCFVVKAAYDIFIDSIDKLTDKSCDDATLKEILELVSKQENVIGVDLLQTRVFANKIYVDIEISADGNKSLFESHAVAEKIHELVEKNFNNVKHCMVHVNPK